MIVYFSAEARVEAEDGVSFTLQLLRMKKSGPKWDVAGHYATLEQAARAAVNKKVLSTPGDVQARELVAAIERASQRIADACEFAISAAGAAQCEGDSMPTALPEDLFEEAV